MNVIVSKHAVEQYRLKMLAKISDDEIQKILRVIAVRGKFIQQRPGDAYSLEYNGLRIAVTNQNNTLRVITFLGNKKYSAWSMKNDIRPRYKKAVV